MTATKPPAPWSDEWIDALIDGISRNHWTYKTLRMFARAVAREAFEEAAMLADNTTDLDRGCLDVPDAIRARAKEVCNDR